LNHLAILALLLAQQAISSASVDTATSTFFAFSKPGAVLIYCSGSADGKPKDCQIMPGHTITEVMEQVEVDRQAKNKEIDELREQYIKVLRDYQKHLSADLVLIGKIEKLQKLQRAMVSAPQYPRQMQ
jgi:hypothetical protein